ncbi:MAG: helix-turn-helix transcriptional regulator [Lachnospiraceae bacterium]|nr:helix-turn-helix transcriptional regulator [Lachnospiraceae bacterium]
MQKILIVAEGSLRYKHLRNMIENGHEEAMICRCSSMSEAAETIRSEGADVIVADVSSSIAEGDEVGRLPFSPTKGNAKQDLGYIKQYIRDHYNEPINNSKLAAIIHLTPNYLCTLFKKEEKMTVRAYIETVRLERAVFLLITDDMSISDISTEVGYKQPSYFCRVFRNHYHETPSQYRENRRSMERSRRNG